MADLFEIPQIARAARVKPNTLRVWVDRGLLPCAEEAPRRGQPRHLDLRAAAVAAVLQRLRHTFGLRFPLKQVAARLLAEPNLAELRGPRGFQEMAAALRAGGGQTSAQRRCLIIVAPKKPRREPGVSVARMGLVPGMLPQLARAGAYLVDLEEVIRETVLNLRVSRHLRGRARR